MAAEAEKLRRFCTAKHTGLSVGLANRNSCKNGVKMGRRIMLLTVDDVSYRKHSVVRFRFGRPMLTEAGKVNG